MNIGIVWTAILSLVLIGIAGIDESAAQADDLPPTTNSTHPHIEHHSITGNIPNDPIAQDILKKIEATRLWIEQIEDLAKDNQELQDMRAQTLDRLQKDLEFMEEQHKHLTFEYRLEQMRNQTISHQVNWSNNTAAVIAYNEILKAGGSEQYAVESAQQMAIKVYGIFYDNLSYTYSKIKEGQRAFAFVIDNGGTPHEAQIAYASAAQITQSDMIAINALNNVNNNMAYYNQQLLFEHDGQFNVQTSGDELRLYYQDYRLDPNYIIANPDDPSWRSVGKVDASTECRDDHVLVYRNHARDHVCTTYSTAELWQKNDMGKIVVATANPYDLSIEQLQQDRINKKVEVANKKIQSVISSHTHKLDDLDIEYEKMHAEMQKEKEIDTTGVTDPDLLAEIESRYKLEWDIVLENKERYAQLIKDSQTDLQNEIIDMYKDDRDIKIVWNLKDDAFYAVKK